MTVKELIKELSKLNPKSKVYICASKIIYPWSEYTPVSSESEREVSGLYDLESKVHLQPTIHLD